MKYTQDHINRYLRGIQEDQIPTIDPVKSIISHQVEDISPFDQSPIGQLYNSQENEDNRTNQQKAQDAINEQITGYAPMNRVDPVEKTVSKPNSVIPVENIENVLGPELSKLTSPNQHVQIPFRPEESEMESIGNVLPNKFSGKINPQISTSKSQEIVKTKSSSTPAPRNEAPQTIAPTESSPIPQPENDFEQKLAAARDADRENQMLFGLLKAAQMGGSALASGKADTSYADKMLEDKNKFATQLKTDMDMTEQDRAVQEKNQLRDPNSDISKQARAMLGSVYPDLLAKNPNITAEQLEKMGMNLGALAASRENIAARKEQSALQRELMRERKQDKMDLNLRNVTNEHMDTYNKQLHKDYQNLQQAETNATLAKNIINGTMIGVTPGAGDIAMLYNFIKGLDKNSAVREGEIGLSKQARSVLGRLDSEVKRISGGDLLDADTRAAFAELIDAAAKAERLNFTKQKANIIRTGIEKGIDPEKLNRGIYADIPVNFNALNSTTIDSGIKKPSKGNISGVLLQDYAKKHNKSIEEAANILTKAGYNVQR